MARVANNRTGHVQRSVLPAATRLLIEAACRIAPVKELCQVADIDMGQSPPGNSCNDSKEGLPLLGGPSDLGDVYPAPTRWTTAPTKTSRNGDILVCVRATIGEPRWADGEYCVGRGLAAVRPKTGDTSADYLFHVIEGHQDLLREQGTGTTFKTISKSHLEALRVPILEPNEQVEVGQFLRWLASFEADHVNWGTAPSLPDRLSEQRRIVTRIEELAAQVSEAQRLRRLAVEEAEALALNQIGNVFSRLCTRYPVREFGSFSPHVTSGPRNWAKHYEKGGFRFYRAQDIGPAGNIIDDGKVFISPPAGAQGRSAMLQTGDLMLVITGATVGRVSIFQDRFEPGFVSQHVSICRLPQVEVDPSFALWGLRGPNGQAQLLGKRYGQGKPGLNLSNIRSLSLPFPPLPEQRRIVSYLDGLQEQVDALKHLQDETAAELDALLPSILDKAFRGEL